MEERVNSLPNNKILVYILVYAKLKEMADDKLKFNVAEAQIILCYLLIE